MIFNAEKYGIIPGEAVGGRIYEVLAEIARTEGEKVLEFPAGTYFIDAADCPERELHITNTISRDSYKNGEKPNCRRVAFLIENTKDLTIRGENAKFISRGRLTWAAVLDSENITFDGIELAAENPDLHDFTVEKVGLTYADFRLDEESTYIKKSDGFYFTGVDYETPFTINTTKWGYFGKYNPALPDKLVRSRHPFFGNLGIKETGKNTFRVRYLSAAKLKKGDRYSIYDVRRTDVGFFCERTKNIRLVGVKQRFNIALAFVAQNCENIEIDSVDFCAADGQLKRFASFADFIQVCMCRGDVLVKNSRFIGAGDDVLNVHGTHFKITEIDGNTVLAKFCHPESYGYLAFNTGDEIEFVNSMTLLAEGSAKVISASLTDDYTVRLELDTVRNAKKGQVIENITLCPNLHFTGNYMSQIVTRGLLITTRGDVLVENNDFANTVMPAILCSDDARSWYESGPCRNVTIRNNHFGDCDKPYIQILPENSPNTNPVHGDYLIEGNTFEHANGVDARRCNSITFRNNTLKTPCRKFVKCTNVTKTDIQE